MPEARILLACSGLSLLRAFVKTGQPVAVAECDPEALTLRSRYPAARYRLADPLLVPDQAIDDLVRLGKSFAHPPMLAFDSEVMLLAASRHRVCLAPYYRFLFPPPWLVEDTTCKLRFAALAERLGLPSPRSMVPTERTTLDEITDRIGFPLILKPNSHVGRFRSAVVREGRLLHMPHKALRADNPAELELQYATIQRLCGSFVIQEYIPGDDTCLYSFHAYLNSHSQPLGYFVGRKVRTYPMDTGFSTFLELAHQAEVVRVCLEALERMRFVGPVKLDLKWDPLRRRFQILECNTRFTLWSYLGCACGVNLPLVAWQDLHGDPVTPQTNYRTNVRWLSLGNDLRTFLREYRPTGKLNWLTYLWSLRGRKVHEMFCWRDPLPSLVWARTRIMLKCRKLWRRLTEHREGLETVATAAHREGESAVVQRTNAP